ncbi:MAG: protein of unknown function [Leptospirillum rubarum]|nr:MAG: protein of unknown function [Leptospirillum rubarum]
MERSPGRPDDHKGMVRPDIRTVLWIGAISIAGWVLLSDTWYGVKSLFLHLSLQKTKILGVQDTLLSETLSKGKRDNRIFLASIGRLDRNRERLFERVSAFSRLFGRKVTVKRSPSVSLDGVPLFRQTIRVRYSGSGLSALVDLPEWKRLGSLPGVALVEWREIPSGSSGRSKTISVRFHVYGSVPNASSGGKKKERN